MPDSQAKISFLEFLPVSLFGSVLGLAGLSFSWGWAEKTWGVSPAIGTVIGAIAILSFLLLTIVYAIKLWKYPALVKAEFNHPVSVSFFGAFIISLLLLPGIIYPYSKELAIGMWVVGTVLIFLFAWLVLRKWLDHQQDAANALPAWVIPVVGTLDVPIIGYRLPIPGIHEICLFFFGIGVFFAIILLTIIISRLLFHPPLPEALQPTLMILVGPFALAFSGYESITGSHDMVSGMLFYFDLFLLLLLGSKILLIPRCCPFRVTWWAVGFPLVAITIASFRYASHMAYGWFYLLPGALLTISTGIILFLLVQTIYKLLTNKLFLSNTGAERATRLLEPTKRTA